MATLRPIEERDAKGNVIKLNPSITFIQDPTVRQISGRHDWKSSPNPAYHEPITAQVQNGKILFFVGRPETAAGRTHAKEISQTKVNEIAPYIIENLIKCPIRVREQRPTVYEVRVASMEDQDIPQVVEHTMQPGATSITIDAVAPELDPTKARLAAERGGRPIPADVDASA